MLPDLKGKGLFVFSDPGGAKAVLALIQQLKEKGYINYKAISDREHSFYKEFNVEVERITQADVDKTFNGFKPDYVFTGTSYTSLLELNCISFAKQLKMPTYAFIDHWTSLKNRFKLNNEYIFPENVLVIDEKAFELAVNEGIPAQLLKVFSNPYYSYLQNWNPIVSKEDFLRRNGMVNFTGKIISYLPEPLSNAGGKKKFGTDEYECMDILYNSVIRLNDKNFVILIKPHPNQNKYNLTIKMLNLQGKKDIVMKIIEEDINTLIYYSDLVAGIFSNALVETSFFHKPIFRILKGLTIADPLESMNVGTCIYSEDELTNELKKYL